MPVTTADLSKALGKFSIAKADDTKTVSVDLLKVTSTLKAELAKASAGGDPEAVIKALSARVEAIEAVLSKAAEDDAGNVVVTTGKADLAADEFAVTKAEDKADAKKDGMPMEEDMTEEDGEEEYAPKRKGKTKKSAAPVVVDKDGWPKDLAPSTAPLTKAERRVRGEAPIPFRTGTAKRQDRVAAARSAGSGPGVRRLA